MEVSADSPNALAVRMGDEGKAVSFPRLTALLCEHFALPLADVASVSFPQKLRQFGDIRRDPVFVCARSMRRREFITLLGGAVATWPLATRSQESVRVHRLGFLTPTSGPTPNHKALDDALAALGYQEGQNLLIERRYAAGNDRLPILAAELVQANVDVIVTETSAAALAAKNATPDCIYQSTLQ